MIHSFLLHLIAMVTLRVVGMAPSYQMTCSSYGYHLVLASFGNEKHLLCLKFEEIGSSGLASEDAAVLIDPEAPETTDTIMAYPLHNFTMAYGFPVETPSKGSAEGYIGDDHHFYGVLHLGGRTLHADPYGRDEPKKSTAFDNDYNVAPRRAPRRDRDVQMAQDDGQYGPQFQIHLDSHKQVAGVAPARICQLLLLADKEFFEKDAKSSMNHAVRRMLHAVGQVDTIFRNADFNEDGLPDNIGFSVKYIVVVQSSETNQRIFGDTVKSKTIDGWQYLMQFSRLRRLSEVCLGIAFSGHAFRNLTLGLSFTALGGEMGGAAGGVCDRRAYGRSLNTLALAHATADYSERVPERIAVLTLAHELGHSFGAHHDESFPSPECGDGYLMGSQSDQDGSRVTEFSVCSKRLIAAALDTMSYCFLNEDTPYCGNGIVEEGEACDCGLPSRCSERDPCCTPRAGGAWLYENKTLYKEGCTVTPDTLCHPSQGLCCNTQCKYANLTQYGIECERMDRRCTCEWPSARCRCGLGGRCLADGSCHAAECALLGLRECQCYGKGPGGVVSAVRRCGVCCRLEAGQCVGAELAARARLANGTALLHRWPDTDYTGPNVTVTLCESAPHKCREVSLRAWPTGSPCVTRGSVGLCAISGVCKPGLVWPRSNIFPTVMAKNSRPMPVEVRSVSSSKAVARKLLALDVPVIVGFVSCREVKMKTLYKFITTILIYLLV